MNLCAKLVPILTALSLVACASGGGGGEMGEQGRAPTSAGPDLQGVPEILDLRTEWEWPVPPRGSAGMPAGDSEGAALTTARERLVVLDASGKARWAADNNSLRDVAPLLTPDRVVAATEEGVAAYDRATGRRVWEAEIGERANTPVLAGDQVVVSTWEGSLVALDLADGKTAWRVSLGGPSLGPAAAGGSTAVATFAGGGAAGLVAVDVPTGRLRWAVPLPNGGVSAPAVAGDTVVVVAGDVAVHGLSLDDGSARWWNETKGAGSPEVPPLPLPDGTVLAAHRQGGFLAVRAADGEPLWLATSDGASVRGGPAGPGLNGWFALPLDDGRLFLAHPPGVNDVRTPPDGLVSGVAVGPDGLLLIATALGDQNLLTAMRGW